MVRVIKNVALAGLYLETGNLTNSGKIPSLPETMAYSTVPTRLWDGGRAVMTLGLTAPGHEPRSDLNL
jgi:hypothetical protein